MPSPCFTYHFTGNGCAPKKAKPGVAEAVAFVPCSSYAGYKTRWVLNDSGHTTSTALSPVFDFKTCGVYTVTLFITDTITHVTDSLTDTIDIKCSPQATLVISDTAGCSGSAYTFYTQVDCYGASHTSTWDLGTGKIYTGDTLKNFRLYNLNPSGITVYGTALHVTCSNGCDITLSKDTAIRLSAKPTAHFSTGNYSSCLAPATVSFVNTSLSHSASPLQYKWFFKGGTPSVTGSFNPTIFYASSKTYPVTLVAIDSFSGCTDTLTQAQAVVLKSFTHSLVLNALSCTRDSVLLKDSINGQTVLNRSWQVKPAGSVIIKDKGTYALGVFNTPGLYTICETVLLAGGCVHTVCHTINVLTKPVAKIASGLPLSACTLPQDITCVDSSQAATKVKWLASSSTSIITGGRQATFTYNTCGPKPVTLVAYDSTCTDTAHSMLNIPCYTIQLNTVGTTKYCAPVNVHFSSSMPDSGYAYITDTSGKKTGGTIYFKDTFSVYFAHCGTYTIHAFVHNTTGCNDSAIKTVYIHEKPVIHSISFDTLRCYHDTISLRSDVTTCGNDTISYTWVSANPQKLFNGSPYMLNALDTGRHTIKLIADDGGCADTFVSVNTLHIRGPKAAFSIAYRCKPYDSVQLSTGLKGTEQGTWAVSTSTGTLSYSGAQASYSTKGCGNFLAKLTVHDNTCADSVIQTIRTRLLTPHVNIPAGTLCNNRGYNIINATGTCPSWTDYTFQLKFRSCSDSLFTFIPIIRDTAIFKFPSGFENVRLIATSINGCKDSASVDSLDIKGISVRITDSLSNNICLPALLSAQYKRIHTCNNDSIISTEWQVFDNNVLVQDTVSASLVNKTLTRNGCYAIHLVTSDKFGCIDTAYKSVTCFSGPKAFIRATKDTLCFNSTDTFSLDLVTTKGKVNVIWDFKDGDTTNSHKSITTHAFKDPNTAYRTYIHTFIIKATVSDSICDTILSYPVTVIYPRAALFSIGYPVSVCSPLNAVIGDSLNEFKHRYWQFDATRHSSFIRDDSNKVAQTYLHTGNYIVRMVGVSAGGCTDTVTLSDTFSLNALNATHHVTPAYSCVPGVIKATAAIPPGTKAHWVIADKYYSTTPIITDTLFTAGVYTARLIVDDSVNNCSAVYPPDTLQVDKPTPNLSVDSVICAGALSIARVKAHSTKYASLSYAWRVDTSGYTLSGDSFKINSAYTGTSPHRLSVRVSTPGGCKDSASVAFTIVQPPLARIYTTDSALCLDKLLILIDSSTYYQPIYSRNWLIHHTTYTSQAVLFRETAAGSFADTLIVKDIKGCSDTAFKVITVYPLPLIKHTPDTTVCKGNRIKLIAGGGKSYRWTPVNKADSVNSSPIVSVTDSSRFYITVSDSHGCSSKDSMYVHVWPLPGIKTKDTSACFNDSVYLHVINLDPSHVLKYAWLPASLLKYDTTGSPLLQAVKNTLFVVKATDVHGCESMDSLHLNVLALPVITATGSTHSCINNCDTIKLSGALTYSWYAVPSIKGTANPLIHCQNVPGLYTYYINGTDSNHCTGKYILDITTYNKPVVSISAPQIICAGDVVYLIASGANAYTFINPYALIQTFSDRITIAPLKDTVYKVAGTNAYGCYDTAAKTIDVIPMLSPHVIPSDTDICKGAYVSLYATGGSFYYWHPVSGVNNNAQLILIQPTKDATLYVTVSNTCFNIDLPVHIRVHAVPYVKACPDQYILNGQTTTVSAKADTTGTYIWSPANSLTDTIGQIVKAHPKVTTIYTVMFKGTDGCITYDSTTVYLVCNDKGITVPNVFTPTDPNGQNTKVRPLFSGDAHLQLFMIYDRWGNLMFETHEATQGWDGRLHGQLAEQGVYAYYLEAVCGNGKIIKSQGNITLLK